MATLRVHLTACLALAAAFPACAAPLTPEALETMPRLSDCQLSPDGHWLALNVSRGNLTTGAVDTELRIYAYPAVSAVVARVPGAFHPRWSPGGERLLYQQVVKDETQAFICDTGGWQGRQITHHASGVQGCVWAPDGQRLAFVAGVLAEAPGLAGKDSGRLYDDLFLRRWKEYYDGKRQHLFVVGLGASGAEARPADEPRDVTPGAFDAYPTSSTFSSGDNFCFSANGQALLFAAPPARGQASTTNYDVYRVDLASLKRENLTEANLAADLGPRLSPDGTRLYVMSQQRSGYESDFLRVRSCPVDPSGSPTGSWTTDPADPYSLIDYRPFPKGAMLARIEGSAVKEYWCPSDGRPVLLNAGGSFDDLSADRSGERWVAVESSLTQPPHLVLGTRERRDRVVYPDPLPGLDLGSAETLQVPVEGASMQMFLVKPPNFDPHRRWPVAFLVHGGPQGGWMDDWGLRWNAQAWAAQGYVVAMPNPRGSSGGTHLFQEQVSRDWGGLAYRDLMTAADAVAALPYVDANRMCAAGASYGGYMINWISVNNGRFKALVTHDGVWDLDSEFGTTDELWFPEWEMGGPPWGASLANYEQFSPHRRADQLARYKTPHLVIHNDLDYRCPINQGLELFTALQLQGVPSKFLNFPDEGHWVTRPLNGIRWYREVFAFLGQYCRP